MGKDKFVIIVDEETQRLIINSLLPTRDANSKAGSYSVTIPNVADGETWVAKSFVQYKDAQGVLRVVYSDLTEATK